MPEPQTEGDQQVTHAGQQSPPEPESRVPGDATQPIPFGLFQQVVLMQQIYVIDGKASVEQAVKEAEKEVGAPIKVASFVRYALGEGIERKEEDFAAEVAKAAGRG